MGGYYTESATLCSDWGFAPNPKVFFRHKAPLTVHKQLNLKALTLKVVETGVQKCVS